MTSYCFLAHIPPLTPPTPSENQNSSGRHLSSITLIALQVHWLLYCPSRSTNLLHLEFSLTLSVLGFLFPEFPSLNHLFLYTPDSGFWSHFTSEGPSLNCSLKHHSRIPSTPLPVLFFLYSNYYHLKIYYFLTFLLSAFSYYLSFRNMDFTLLATVSSVIKLFPALI